VGRGKGEFIKIRVLSCIAEDVNGRGRETESLGRLLCYFVVTDIKPEVYPTPGRKSCFSESVPCIPGKAPKFTHNPLLKIRHAYFATHDGLIIKNVRGFLPVIYNR